MSCLSVQATIVERAALWSSDSNRLGGLLSLGCQNIVEAGRDVLRSLGLFRHEKLSLLSLAMNSP
jgi:hypothetical protein